MAGTYYFGVWGKGEIHCSTIILLQSALTCSGLENFLLAYAMTTVEFYCIQLCLGIYETTAHTLPGENGI